MSFFPMNAPLAVLPAFVLAAGLAADTLASDATANGVDLATTCLDGFEDVITIRDEFGSAQYEYADHPDKIGFDAFGASWQPEPTNGDETSSSISVTAGLKGCWVGGRVLGQETDEGDGAPSGELEDAVAAVSVAGRRVTPVDFRVEWLEVSGVPHALRSSFTLDYLIVQKASFDSIRSNCVVLDGVVSTLVIRDSLIDGCSYLVDDRNGNFFLGDDAQLLIRDSVIRLRAGADEPPHSVVPLPEGARPRVKVVDSVFLLEGPVPLTEALIAGADAAIGECRDNIVILGEGGEVVGPVPPCFRIMRNQEVWTSAKNKWLETREQEFGDQDDPAPGDGEDDPDDPTDVPSDPDDDGSDDEPSDGTAGSTWNDGTLWQDNTGWVESGEINVAINDFDENEAYQSDLLVTGPDGSPPFTFTIVHDPSGQLQVSANQLSHPAIDFESLPTGWVDNGDGTATLPFKLRVTDSDANSFESDKVLNVHDVAEGGDGGGDVPASAQWFYVGDALTDAEIDDYNAVAQTNFNVMESGGTDEERHQMSPDQDFRIRIPGTYYPPFIIETDQSADILRGDVHFQKIDSHTDRHTMWEVIQNADETTFSTFDTYNAMDEHHLYKFGYQFYIPSTTNLNGLIIMQAVISGAGGPWVVNAVDALDGDFRWRVLGDSQSQPSAGGDWESRQAGVEPITLDEWHTVEWELIIDPDGTTDGYAKIVLDGRTIFDSSVSLGGPIQVGPNVPSHPSPFFGVYRTGGFRTHDPVNVYMRNLWFEE